jgi:hypothetical protein
MYTNSFKIIVENIWIVRLSGSAAGCGSVAVCRSAVQQCAGVRAAVCGSRVHGSVHAVRVIVCSSALGSVRQRVRQCGGMRQCAVVCGSVQQSCARSARGNVQQCVAVCGSVWQCAW